MDWEAACQILGVSATATAAEIDAQYRYKAQLLHPDKTTSLPESIRHKAEEELKRINAAYAILKEPKNRPQANPPRLSVSPRYIRFKDVEPNQQKTTIIEIESIGGSYTKFWMDDRPSAWLKVVEVKSTTNDPLPLEVTIEATGSSPLHRRSECMLPIRLENEKTNTRDEIIVKIELQMKAATRRGAFSIFGIRIRNPFAKAKPTPTYVPRPTRPKKGRRVFVVSDTHFDHTNIIRYCNRPFRYPDRSPNRTAMNRALISNWNLAVSRNDIVYFVGDLRFGRHSRPPGYWLKRLNGRKIIIRGSHDGDIRGARDLQVLDHGGMRFLLVHKPSDAVNWNGWTIHGHHHRDARGNCPTRYPFINGQSKTVNVNVELTDYRPVSLDYLCSLGLDGIKRMNTIRSIPERW